MGDHLDADHFRGIKAVGVSGGHETTVGNSMIAKHCEQWKRCDTGNDDDKMYLCVLGLFSLFFTYIE